MDLGEHEKKGEMTSLVQVDKNDKKVKMKGGPGWMTNYKERVHSPCNGKQFSKVCIKITCEV